ncbi:carboxyl transferase domain-containing protein [Gordonia caeni]|uniref:Acetyl-coenzyme A carboxylase carboxyl transferase subunits beta/alpha n=1 Tax=Gordonia caeni TaxID=1007097 RepID=A0ABP7PPV3_9ACTN
MPFTPQSWPPHSRRRSAREVIAALVGRTWQSWDEPVRTRDEQEPGDPGYAEQLARARERTGCDESILTGAGTVAVPGSDDRRRVVLIVSEFGFLGGSIGEAAGRRVVAALRRATELQLPVLALPASGGTRMQEGTPAFLQMAAITAAVNAHRRAGLLYLVYLRDPVTGGVLASWGSLGHAMWAEPGALIGFLGPKVYRALLHQDFPAGVQRAENLHEHGVVDAVVPFDELPARLARFLQIRNAMADPLAVERLPAHRFGRPATAWEAVEITRDPDRPGLARLLESVPTAMIVDHGPIRVALAQLGDHAVVLVGADAPTQEGGRLIDVDALGRARRGITLAAELGLPLVTLIDTPGAELSVRAEQEGLAGEIADCLAELLAVNVPTVSILFGQGAGGAALALFPADRVIAARDAWLAPLPPEGAAALVLGDPGEAAELVGPQRIWAADLLKQGIVDDLAAGYAQVIGYVVEYLDQRPRPQFERRPRG